MTSNYGYKIIGSQEVFHFGMSMSISGDFNKDGRKDILISAMTLQEERIIYIIFGDSLFHNIHVLIMQRTFSDI
jgi:hypothetical protein